MKLVNAALIAAVLATGGVAQAQSMGQGYNMLVAALDSDFRRIGLSTDRLDDITVAQLAEIKQIIESDDGDTQKKGRIEAVLRDN